MPIKRLHGEETNVTVLFWTCQVLEMIFGESEFYASKVTANANTLSGGPVGCTLEHLLPIFI